ncbi:MAG: thioredoxin family protein [Candidatus Omnitrophica bacterium]|nr:thioredoxin family protein [Candidatus Omnitrophota bacterium]
MVEKKEPGRPVKNKRKIAFVILIAAVAFVFVLKAKQQRPQIETSEMSMPEEMPISPPPETLPPQTGQEPSKPAEKRLPRLVDLGANQCLPCKMMAPILEELKREYRGRMEVEIIDVWQDPRAGERYGIRVIPTQIFYDQEGRERFRHEGFMSKEDILTKWKELGIDF